MFEADQYIRPAYRRLIIAKICWYLFLVFGSVANFLRFDHFGLDMINGALALLFTFFAFKTWRLS